MATLALPGGPVDKAHAEAEAMGPDETKDADEMRIAVTRRCSGPLLLPLTVIRGPKPGVRRQCSPRLPKNTRKSFWNC